MFKFYIFSIVHFHCREREVQIRKMLRRTRRRVVEEEVTEVISPNRIVAFIEQRERREREEREQMKSELNRLNSFNSWWLDKYQVDVSVRQHLTKAGFYHLGGTTRCFSCGLFKHATSLRRGYDPETVHHEESPNCKFITGQSDNVPIERWMRCEQNRLNSFPPWWGPVYQLDVSVTHHLAKAGFCCWFGDTVFLMQTV